MGDNLAAWIGRQETARDRIDPSRSNALVAALDQGAGGREGDSLPPLHHWLYFWDVRPPAMLGPDGHPARGGFLPPVALPRRMWAGGRVAFHQPIRLGEEVERVSTILNVAEKTGRSGALVFVTVEHRLSGEGGLALVEEHDIVYREAATSGSAAPPAGEAPPPPERSETVMPDSLLLFRYSALTMNGHRIHYDRAYAADAELYPGLVVHGPLQATLMAGLAQRMLGRGLTHFSYRGLAPAFDGAAMDVCARQEGDGLSLWTRQGATINMSASAR